VKFVNKKLHKLLIGEFSLKRLMTSLLLIPVLVYLGFSIFAYFIADKLIFQPPFSTYRDDDKILKLTTVGGEKISARFYESSNATHTILFSHGNGEDIGLPAPMIEELQKNGFAVFVYDYRGYGTSEGKPTEENVYQDIDAAYDYLVDVKNLAPDKIIVHGRSLGGAVSVDLASRKKVGGLVVESSFVTASRVLTKYPVLPFDKFQSVHKIKNIQCPVLFIHSRKDDRIGFWHSEKLLAEANEPKFSLWIDDAHHNNLFDVAGKTYLQAIRDFADNLPE
jgi:fermentation-respiration switch protein FrsA (DUF1100 family)